MRVSIMTSSIILCFALTLFSILTVNSVSNAKLAAQTNLNASVDSVMHALQTDKTYNENNYEEIVGDLLQNVILQTDGNGIVDVKILNANTEEGLLDVEITKQFNWMGLKKHITARRTVILDEYDNPPEEMVKVVFKYNDGSDDLTWKQEDSFVGALLKRPKQPKRSGYNFVGWSTTEGGNVISNEEWQDYIIPDVPDTPKTLTFYAVFESKA